jgi:hypothetical protein
MEMGLDQRRHLKTSHPQDLDSYILTHSATVRDVERVTGIRFYTEVPVYEAIRLRTQLPTKLWHLETGL